MKRIYKYQIRIDDRQVVMLPYDAQILTVQAQNDIPYIWAMVDPTMPTEAVNIRMHGTGHDVPDDSRLEYIGTFQIMRGSLVYHVFKEV